MRANVINKFLCSLAVLLFSSVVQGHSQSTNEHPGAYDSFMEGILSPAINAKSFGRYHKSFDTYTKRIKTTDGDYYWTYTFYSSHQDIFPEWLKDQKYNQIVTRVQFYSSPTNKLSSVVKALSEISASVSGVVKITQNQNRYGVVEQDLNESLKILGVEPINLGVDTSHLKDNVVVLYIAQQDIQDVFPSIATLDAAKGFRRMIESENGDKLRREMGRYTIVCEMFLLWEIPLQIIDKYMEHYRTQ